MGIFRKVNDIASFPSTSDTSFNSTQLRGEWDFVARDKGFRNPARNVRWKRGLSFPNRSGCKIRWVVCHKLSYAVVRLMFADFRVSSVKWPKNEEGKVGLGEKPAQESL